MTDSRYKCGYDRTFTDKWAVYQVINCRSPKLTSIHDTLQTANNHAKSIWNQFNKHSISDEVITCNEPNLPYNVFKCVNYNACSLSVYVSELPLSSFNVKELKQFGHNNFICLDGCKRKQQLYNRVKPVIEHKIHINNLIEFDPENCIECALNKMNQNYKQKTKTNIENKENKNNLNLNKKRKQLNLENEENNTDNIPKKKRKLNDNNIMKTKEELIEMGIPQILHQYKWLYVRCNMLNNVSREKIVKYLMGKYTKTDEKEDVLLHSETNEQGTVTTESIFRMLFQQKKWKRVSRKRKK